MGKELNLYYCDHNDVIAERIGDILEDMGIFTFSALCRRQMNIVDRTSQKASEIRTWYAKNSNGGGRVNIVLFLTKFIKTNPSLEYDLKLIRDLSRYRGVNIFTIVDDEMRAEINTDNESFSWLYEQSDVFDVYNHCIIADTIDVARALTMELVRQRFKGQVKKELPDKAFDRRLLKSTKDNKYIASIANAYDEIPDDDCPSKFLLIFSVFKYVEQSVGRSHYSKCMEYLLRRSVKEFLMTKKDLELSKACLIYDMMKIYS